jgi:ubiquinone/menaquinone biosynthesis C-methylase UbiE
MWEYYERRAGEYDDAYRGVGIFWADRSRSGLAALSDLTTVLAALPSARTLDIGCGTGYLTGFLPGLVVGLDQSRSMLSAAARRLPHLGLVRGNALALPFRDAAFERVFASLVYGRLQAPERRLFLAEARRVAAEVVLVETRLREGHVAQGWEERRLSDGSVFRIYVRRFDERALLAELGGGEVVFASGSFIVASVPRRSG